MAVVVVSLNTVEFDHGFPDTGRPVRVWVAPRCFGGAARLAKSDANGARSLAIWKPENVKLYLVTH